MALKLIGLATALILMASPTLAFESESSEITLLPQRTVSGEAALSLPEVEALEPFQSMAPSANALALPEPETTPIAPYSGCHRNKEETVYLTN